MDDHDPLYLVAWDDGFTLVSLRYLGDTLGILRARGYRITSVTAEPML